MRSIPGEYALCLVLDYAARQLQIGALMLTTLHTRVLPGVPIGGAGTSQIFVRCSDPNVICDSKKVPAGEPHDIFIKVRPSHAFFLIFRCEFG